MAPFTHLIHTLGPYLSHGGPPGPGLLFTGGRLAAWQAPQGPTLEVSLFYPILPSSPIFSV